MTLEDADLRTLPRRAGAGSYGALSRPAENVSQMHAASAGLGSLEGLAKNAPVAQLDRALDYESRGQEFESLRARQYGDNSIANPWDKVSSLGGHVGELAASGLHGLVHSKLRDEHTRG